MAGGQIAVIGAGMAGLSAAYRLERAGFAPTVFERHDRVGGRIQTIEKAGYLMDLGAAVYLGTYRESIAMIRDIGLGNELRELPAIGAMPRNGKLHLFDYAAPIRTALTTKALSFGAKLRAAIADHIKAVGRVPVGKSMYTVLGSHEYLHRSWQRSDDEVLADAIACTSRYHGDISNTVEQHQIVRWEEVVPVLDTGRFKLIAAFKHGLTANARVQFASDLDRIPGVNGAIVSGLEAAQRIAAGSHARGQGTSSVRAA